MEDVFPGYALPHSRLEGQHNRHALLVVSPMAGPEAERKIFNITFHGKNVRCT